MDIKKRHSEKLSGEDDMRQTCDKPHDYRDDITFHDYAIPVKENKNLEDARSKLTRDQLPHSCRDPEKPYRSLHEEDKPGLIGQLFLDIHGRIIDINLAGTEILGMCGMRINQRKLRDYVMPEDRVRFEILLNQLFSGCAFPASENIRICMPAGKTIPIRISGLLLKESDRKNPDTLLLTFFVIPESEFGSAATGNILTHFKSDENVSTPLSGSGTRAMSPHASHGHERRTNCEQLRQLSHRAMAILENERKIIAREIHDSLGGSLAAIKFRLEEILSKNRGDLELSDSLEKTVEYLQDTIKKTKRISAGLRPTMLDDLGLKATIRWSCRKLRESCPDISFFITINIDEKAIDESLKIVIYRIIQEAMANAMRHSEADTIWLCLTQSTGRIDLEVKDNGRGFVPDNCVSSPKCLETTGYGLTEIKEKTEICGGTFFLKSYENEGTLLYVSLPLTGI